MITRIEEGGLLSKRNYRVILSAGEQAALDAMLRPDTGDGWSLPCVACGVTTPDAMFTDCCAMPMCDNCRPGHAWCDEEPT